MTVFNRVMFLKKLEETDHEVELESEFFITAKQIKERAKSYSTLFRGKFYIGYIHTIQDADYFYKECGAIYCNRTEDDIIFRKSEI
jgi:hypothetical protein